MSLFLHMRARKTAWGSRVLALFAMVWLNLALQPCVMAIESTAGHDGGCPHCPPAEHHQMHGSHETTAMPCAGSADCGDLDDFHYDGRDTAPKFDPAPDHDAALPAPTDAFTGITVLRPRSRAPPPDHDGAAAPPLHLLHCVFLN